MAMLTFTPTTETVAPGAAIETASAIVASLPTASMTASTPAPPVRSMIWAAASPADGVDRLCSQRGGTRQAVRDACRRRTRARGRTTRAHWRARTPTGPEPDHGQGSPRAKVRAHRREVAGGQDVGEEDCLGIGHLVGDTRA